MPRLAPIAARAIGATLGEHMAYPGKIETDALALAMLAGQTPAQLAKTFGAHERTVRRRISEERALHGAEWPIKRPTAKGSRPAPPKAAAAPQPPPGSPGPAATPDEIEAWALAVYVAEASSGERSGDRIAAAKAAVELARERRTRRNPADDGVDPAEAAASVMRAIEDATADVDSSCTSPQPELG